MPLALALKSYVTSQVSEELADMVRLQVKVSSPSSAEYVPFAISVSPES